MQDPADPNGDASLRIRPAPGKLREAHPGLPLAQASRSRQCDRRIQGRTQAALPAGQRTPLAPIWLGRLRVDQRQEHARLLRRPLSDGVFHPRRENRRRERRGGRQHHRLALRARRVQRARRPVRDSLIDRPVRRRTRLLVAASIALALLAGCQSQSLSRDELAALDYGPPPESYEKIVRDYLRTRLTEPDFALIEFKAGPAPLYQKETLLGARQYGWA